jgi:hypothetical protein
MTEPEISSESSLFSTPQLKQVINFADKKLWSVIVQQANSTCSITIADIGSQRLRYPVSVLIEDYGDEYIATWPELNLWGSGFSPAMAISALKDATCELHDELSNIDMAELGKQPRYWKRALAALIDPDDAS